MIDWWGPIIHEYYAGTEGNGFLYIDSEEWLAHPGSVGRRCSAPCTSATRTATSCRRARTAPSTSTSGARLRVPRRPGEDAERRRTRRPGWTTLGDIGYLDEEGYLYLTDRKSYMIISGGVNIYPQEIENVLIVHPKVADVAVFGVPDEEMGEQVKAVVQPVPMDEAGPELEAELIAYCREQLAHFKCPRSVDFLDELPRHPTGKLYKRLLSDEYWPASPEARP